MNFGQLFSSRKGLALLFCATALCSATLYITFFSQAKYTPLFSNRSVAESFPEIKFYLDSYAIPYQSTKEGISVPNDKVHRVRMDLAALELPKTSNTKGYSFFNVESPNEKEAQLLELNTLKRHLEQDIAHYDNIRSAAITLNLASPDAGNEASSTKAAILLDLSPETRLSASQLRAITYHVSGAIKGLAPNRILITDTTGKIYQSIAAEGKGLTSPNIAQLEIRLKEKIDNLLGKLIGQNNFYSTLKLAVDPADANTFETNVNLLINNNAFEKDLSLDGLKKKIEGQINTALSSYKNKIDLQVDVVPFKTPLQTTSALSSGPILYYAAAAMLLLSLALLLGYSLKSKITKQAPTISKSSIIKDNESSLPVNTEPKEPLAEYVEPVQPIANVQLPDEPAIAQESVKPDAQHETLPELGVMINWIEEQIKNDPAAFAQTLRQWMHTKA